MLVLSQITRLEVELPAHRMECAGFQFILWVANNGEGCPVIQRLVATLAPCGIQDNCYLSIFSERLHLTNELVSRHDALSDDNVRM